MNSSSSNSSKSQNRLNFGWMFYVFGFLVLLCFFIFLVFCFNLYLLNSTTPPPSKLSKHYEYFEFNSRTNETKQGFVKLGRILKEPIFFLTKESHFFIIYPSRNPNVFSYSESEIYECSGSCYCEEEEKEEFSYQQKQKQQHRLSAALNSIPLAKSGYFLIVSAISSLFAVSYAKEYFSKKCDDQYNKECSGIGQSIISSVENCVKKMNPFRESFLYACKGNCKMSDGLVEEEHIKAAKIFLCDVIEIEEEVVAFDNQDAVNKFDIAELFPFCDFASPYQTFQDPVDAHYDIQDDIFHPNLCVSDRDTITCYKRLSNLDASPVPL